MAFGLAITLVVIAGVALVTLIAGAPAAACFAIGTMIGVSVTIAALRDPA